MASCSTIDTGSIAPGYVEAFKTIRGAVFGYETDLITTDLIKNIPYASLTLKIGKGPKGLLILESTNNQIDTWISADGVYILTHKGKVIRTSGLEHNLIEFISQNESFRNINLDSMEVFNEYYSYDNPYHRNLKATVKVTKRGKEIVKLFDKETELILIEELIENKKIGWKVRNKYWVDENNFVWKSYQNLSPKLPVFEIEVTKKPSI